MNISKNKSGDSIPYHYRRMTLHVDCDAHEHDRLYSGVYDVHVRGDQSVGEAAAAAIQVLSERTNIQDLSLASIRVVTDRGAQVKNISESGNPGDHCCFSRNYGE